METDKGQIRKHPYSKGQKAFIRLLGGIQSIVNGAAASWKVGNIGVPQLKRMTSYMVARVGQAIQRDDFAAIGSRRWAKLVRADNLPNAVVRLFRNWGMGPALQRHDDYLILTRHECWISDTDLIEWYADAAAAHRSAGNHAAALVELHHAVMYCGKPYLPAYDLLDDYSLSAEQQHWLLYQRDLIHQLARLHIERGAYHEALAAARKTLRLGDDDPADQALLAQIYTLLDNPRLARYYRDRAEHEP